MGRLRRQTVAACAIGGFGITLAAGCVDNNSSMFIQGVLAPEAPDCDVTAAQGSTLLGEGVLDVEFSTEYRAWLLVGNQMTPRGAKQQVRAETSRVSLRGAEIVLEDVEGGGIAEFTVPGTGFVTVNRSEQPGFGAFLTTLIPGSNGGTISNRIGSAYGAQMTVIANIRVFGDTLGGVEVESAELSFPIRVCRGCTIHYPLDAIVNDRCDVAGDEGGNLPCFPGQGGIDCRACASVSTLCRNVPVTTDTASP
jgi:hypothetical protein